jgi:hypothetical protein
VRHHSHSPKHVATAGVLLVLVLSACAGPRSSPEQSRSPSAPGASGSPQPSGSTQAGASDDPAWAAVLGQFPDAQLPAIALIREVTLSEWPVAFAECLSAAGFVSKPTADGGVETDPIPPAQDEAYAVATYACKKSYPLQAKYMAPLSDGQVSALYEYFTTDLTACLLDEGIDVSAPPSLEVFRETIDEASSWSPYRDIDVERLTMDDWNHLSTTCPQFPDYIYDMD